MDVTIRFALQDLVTDYCIGVDRRDMDRFEAIWWPDAVWEIEFLATYSGIEAITGAVREVVWPMWHSTTHYCANHRVTAYADDRASGTCDVYCIGNLADGQAAHVVASYHDEFEQRDGEWRIARRFVNQRAFNPVGAQTLVPPGT